MPGGGDARGKGLEWSSGLRPPTIRQHFQRTLNTAPPTGWSLLPLQPAATWVHAPGASRSGGGPADPGNGSIQTDRAVPHGPPGKVRSGTIAEFGRGMTVLDSTLAKPGSISSRRRPQKGSGCAVSAVGWDRWRSKPRTQGGEEGREGGLEIEVPALKLHAFKARGGLLAPCLQVF